MNCNWHWRFPFILRRSLFLLFLFLVNAALGQKNDSVEAANDYKSHCTSHFDKIEIEGANNAANIVAFLKRYLPHLRNELSDIKMIYRNVSPGGIHYSFVQTFKGVEVYQSEIKVNTDHSKMIHSIFDNSFDTEDWTLDTEGADKSAVIAVKENEALLCERTISGHIEILTKSNQIIYQRDINSYFSPPDSLVWGKIFNPDPLTTAQQMYGGIYVDHNDSNAAWLDNELQTVSFMANFNGAEFSLSNTYIRILDLDLPTAAPATSTINQFFFNRSESGFEDVNAFYHLNTYRQHVHHLGFDIADHSIDVDPHAFGGADQSAFEPAQTPPRLYFGVGGVDDAEDADVITHEYAHFLSYNASPGSNLGSERNSLDEAFGDYAAASYSKAISLFKSDWVFNWDGHNEYWGGRVVNSSKVYPTDLSSSIYKNAEIWSSALMAIHDEIGRNAMDSLIYQTHFSYAANITMSDAAYLLIDADSLLNNGAYYCPIYKHLLERGLIPFFANNPCGINGINDEPLGDFKVLQDGHSFTLMGLPSTDLELKILNIAGQQVRPVITISQTTFRFSDVNLSPGIYLVAIEMQSGRKSTFKWCKVK